MSPNTFLEEPAQTETQHAYTYETGFKQFMPWKGHTIRSLILRMMLFMPVFYCVKSFCQWQYSFLTLPNVRLRVARELFVKWLKAVYILGRLWQIVENGGSLVREATRNWNCVVFHPISASADGSPPSHQRGEQSGNYGSWAALAAAPPARQGGTRNRGGCDPCTPGHPNTGLPVPLPSRSCSVFVWFLARLQIHHQVVGSRCNSGTLFVHLIG